MKKYFDNKMKLTEIWKSPTLHSLKTVQGTGVIFLYSHVIIMIEFLIVHLSMRINEILVLKYMIHHIEITRCWYPAG